ncbi:filamentous hemagglutinin N-terminal domain-containing protein [Arsenophonus apicola]|jgi:filamentous hemagglutinin family protein|uniref:two-partner secretion domain-containing protein n=1 Tax=Arsenophonus apicola TaxID=2879119 RepID=UPI001CDD693C|nr:filamentous hemagglutinin N-terminal domain-containing protein [Arsenophonus apicola]UBX29038.1 filamentous hemagglutinin N-terminal domain-containing protein [Arsenophonus apicola]
MRKNKLSFIVLSIASIFYSFHVTASQNIVIDNIKKKDLSVEIKNGIEHINIEKTDENGISHNYYQKFNISQEGVIIENTNDVAAKIIVNEVTSDKKSFLRGVLAVNGQPAELIIANPNGIKCKGCWFSGSTIQRLLVGKVFYIDEHSLARFRDVGFDKVQTGELLLPTENGDIVFKGINHVHRSEEGRLDLISRHVKIMDHSSLSANTIYAIIGDNIVRVSNQNKLSIIGKSRLSNPIPVSGLTIGKDATIQAKYTNIILTDNNPINNK